jgi:hypothetical protein
MKEYIEREAVFSKLLEEVKSEIDLGYSEKGLGHGEVIAGLLRAKVIVQDEPTADVVARKRGEWLDTREFCGDYMCSNCDALYGTNKFNFCPNCGADMRGEQHDQR